MNVPSTDSLAIDLPEERRPGVPARKEPAPVGNAHWLTPERQPRKPGMTIDPQRAITATFGTGILPRGFSGMLRRKAYRMPDYEPRRWALLLFADRVDGLEDRVLGVARNPLTWVALGVGLIAAARMRDRRTLAARLFG